MDERLKMRELEAIALLDTESAEISRAKDSARTVFQIPFTAFTALALDRFPIENASRTTLYPQRYTE
jgi:hypothetical protein